MWRLLAISVMAACGDHSYAYRADTTPRSVLADLGHKTPIQWQDIMVAVRHRRTLDFGFTAAMSKLFAGPAAPAVAKALTPAVAADPEKLVIEAWVEMRADDVVAVAATVRARIEAEGGRVVSESVIGGPADATSAAFELRLPATSGTAFLDWLAGRGIITSRKVLASDVGKTLVDQQLALDNLKLTMSRLQELARREQPMHDLIEIEKEMTRVRGEIEKLEGEQRWLLDRVAFSTITLTIEREGGPVDFAPHARLHPGAHLSTLSLLDPGGRPRTRIGGGFAVHVERYLTFELDVFPAHDTESRAVVATAGTALYSSLLGDGRRRFFNPYIGARAGYGYLSGERVTIVAADLGIELVKHRSFLVEAAARTVVLFGDARTDVALHTVIGLDVPF